MPLPSAPRPEPFVQPILVMRRSAKPFWPGRRERSSGALEVADVVMSSDSGAVSASGAARAAVSSASVEGREVEAVGRE